MNAEGVPSSRSGPGSSRALRRANEALVVAVIRHQGQCSQAEVARTTGLSPAAVSSIVGALEARGLVARTSAVHGGRRVTALTWAGDALLVAGVDIGRGHLRVVVGDGGRVLVERERPLVPGHRPETTLDTIRREVAEMVDGLGHVGAPASVGVGLPGPLRRSTTSVVNGTILPGWVGVSVVDGLAGVAERVVVENDANLGALAAQVETGARDLLYVKAGSGIGAGLVVDGRVSRGAGGLAGELGHFAIADVTNAPICRCGGRGCLETYASIETMAQSLSTVLDRRVRPSDVLGLARAREPVVRRVFDDAGEAIGRALGAACTLLDPGLVVVGGQLAALGPPFLGAIRAGFDRSALPATAAGTSIRLSALGVRAEVAGALQLARTTAQAARI